MRQLLVYIISFAFSLNAGGQTNHSPVYFIPGDTLQVKEWLKQSGLAQNKNIEDAIQRAQKALSLSERLQYKQGLAGSYAEHGNSFRQKKDYTASLNYYDDNHRMEGARTQWHGSNNIHYHKVFTNSLLGNYYKLPLRVIETNKQYLIFKLTKLFLPID